jgi:hypothetical protein
MKKVSFIMVCLMICSLAASAQTVLNTGYLEITLYRNQLLGSCNLDSAPSNVYVHAGAGKSLTTNWDVVIGNWGIPDGEGEMVGSGDSVAQICMDLSHTTSNYFGGVVHPTDSGAVLPTDNIINMGLVFRAPNGFPVLPGGQFGLDANLKGGYDEQCSDFWLLGVHTDSIGMQMQPIFVTESYDGGLTLAAAVAVTWVTQGNCNTINGTNGIQSISAQSISDIHVSPNPFHESVNITFNMLPDAGNVVAQVYDVMGRKVADFSSSVKTGYNNITWNGAGTDGKALPSGTYLLQVTNGTERQTSKLIKL